jgi:hypothetical protein
MTEVRERVLRAIEFSPDRERITLRRADVRDLVTDEATACASAESWERCAGRWQRVAEENQRAVKEQADLLSASTAPTHTMPFWLRALLAAIIVSAVAYASFLIGLGQSASIPLP